MLIRHINAIRVGVFALLCFLAGTPAFVQQRSQYLSGINAANSGVMPDSGFIYSNIFYEDISDRLKGPNGGGRPTLDCERRRMVCRPLFLALNQTKLPSALMLVRPALKD